MKDDFKKGNDYLPKSPFVGIEELEKEFLEKLKKDKDVYQQIQSMGLTGKQVKANLGLLIDYQEDYNICKKCPGINACPKSNPCYAMTIAKQGEFLDRQLAPCSKIVERMNYESKYIRIDFDDSWRDKTIEDIDPSESRKRIKGLFGAAVIQPDFNDWIYITGDEGTGRSFLTACFCNTLAKVRGTIIAFCDSISLFSELRNMSVENKEKFSRSMATLQKVPLLVLDGFGNEFISDFGFSNILYPLLKARSDRKLFTIFTSDFSLDQIEEMYSQKVSFARATQLVSMIRRRIKPSGGEVVLQGEAVY